MMATNNRFIFQGSPFLPQFDLETVVSNSIYNIKDGFEPAAAIAFVINPIMMMHTTLLRIDNRAITSFGTTEADLHNLTLGYQYSLETILASAVCRKVPTREERLALFEQLTSATHRFESLIVQEHMSQDLNATCNLLALDPSAALVFQFLRDYPFSQDEYFLTGMEIASSIFYVVVTEVVKQTGNDAWLTADYSVRPYIPPKPQE